MGREVETTEFVKFVRRIVRAYGRRVAHADEVDLADMFEIADELQSAMAAAIESQLITYERSWRWLALGVKQHPDTFRKAWLPRISEEARKVLDERNEAHIRAQAGRRGKKFPIVA